MKAFPLSDREPEPVDPSNFTGAGTLVRMDGVSDAPVVNAYRVRFEPRSRTNWHTHSGTQLLLDGRGNVPVPEGRRARA